MSGRVPGDLRLRRVGLLHGRKHPVKSEYRRFCRQCQFNVPVEKAFASGCDRVIVLLTKPEDVLRTSEHNEKLAARIRKKYPIAAEHLCQRARRYNEGVALAQEYARQLFFFYPTSKLPSSGAAMPPCSYIVSCEDGKIMMLFGF